MSFPFRLLGLIIVAGLVYLGWRERDRILPYWHRFADRPEAVAAGTTGRPGVNALQTATGKIDSLNGWRADSVVLSASEMASLIGAGLDWQVRGELDSLTVTLGDGRIAVSGQIKTDGLPRDVLGPLTGAFKEREPVQGAGPVEVTGPGHAVWTVDAFQIRDFDFPREMVPRIIGKVSGQNGAGGLGIVIPPGIGRIRVRPDGVTIYPSSTQP